MANQTVETMSKLYNIFDRLRAERPDTYADDFRKVLSAFSEDGADEANRVRRSLLS